MSKKDKIIKYIQHAINIRANATVRSNRDVIGVVVCDEGDNIWQATSFDDELGIVGECAERIALFYALSNGARNITSIIICAPKGARGPHPCGKCLETFKEFAPHAKIIKTDELGAAKSFKIEELLPD